MASTTTYFGVSYPTSTDYVKDGATAMQTIATGFDTAVAIPVYNNQTGTTYTFVIGDTAKTVTSNNASSVTFTIPPQSSVAWASGASIKVTNLGAGVVTIAGGVGVTVTNTAATISQYSSATLVRTGSDAWTIIPNGSSPTWTSYTPTLTNLTLGNGTLTARYTQIGKTVIVKFSFVLGTTSAVGTQPIFSLPVGITANTTPAWTPGEAKFEDVGGGVYSGFTFFQSTTTIRFFANTVSGAYIKEANVSATVPFTFGNTDGIFTTIIFEAV